MTGSFVSVGIKKAASRRSLILLLYSTGLAIAALLSVTVFRVLAIEFGNSGFSGDLAKQFDIVLWADLLAEDGVSGLAAAVRQFFWAIPLYMVWKVASQVGLIHALSRDAHASFWVGVEKYTLRAIPLALLYLVVAVILTVLVWVIVGAFTVNAGEVVVFWGNIVFGPLATIGVLGMTDMMHDYARMSLVLHGSTVWRSWRKGMTWPVGRFSVILLYKFWFLVATVFVLLPTGIDYVMAKTAFGGIVAAFLLQQVALLLRNGVTVAWIGSEVSLFDEHVERDPDPEDIDRAEDGSQDQTRHGVEAGIKEGTV